MYIRIEHLQLIHYVYFCFGIFTFSTAIILNSAMPLFSYFFFVFYAINSAISWYISFAAKRSLEGVIIFHSLKFIAKHIILTLLTVVFTIALWCFDPWGFLLVDLAIAANYFVFFSAVIWFFFVKLRIVQRFLRIFDTDSMDKAKDVMIKALSLKKEHIIDDYDIRSYRYGTNPEIDKIFVSAMKNKNNKEHIKRLLGEAEILLCTQIIESIQKKLDFLMEHGADKSEIAKYERMLMKKQQKLMEYERELRKAEGI